MSTENKTPELSPALKGKFECVGILPGRVRFGAETIDLTIINLDKAESLVKKNFPYLRHIQPAVDKK
jgi:hypothetical protein